MKKAGNRNSELEFDQPRHAQQFGGHRCGGGGRDGSAKDGSTRDGGTTDGGARFGHARGDGAKINRQVLSIR